MKDKYNDVSQEEIVELMNEYIDKGWTCFIKWTCENCRERVVCNTPNTFFTEGYLHEGCGFYSYPDKFGLVIMKNDKT